MHLSSSSPPYTHIQEEGKSIDFFDPSTWAKQKLFAKTDAAGNIVAHLPVQYEAEAEFIKNAHVTVNFPLSSKITHLGRVVMSQELERRGVPHEQIKRLGLWILLEVLSNHYQNNLPLQAMLGVAIPHCVPTDRGVLNVPRTQVGIEGKGEDRKADAELELLKGHIFPWMENAWVQYQQDKNCFKDRVKNPNSTVHFLRLLNWLREVVLQVPHVYIHIHRVWVYVCVSVCLCVSLSTYVRFCASVHGNARDTRGITHI